MANKIISSINAIIDNQTLPSHTNNVVAIDTQNSRIGVGTATPQYAIDVSGTINTSDLIIKTNGKISNDTGNIELLFNNCPLVTNNVLNSKLSLYFTGNGSKVLNENLLSFGPEFDFVSEMSTMDEFKKDLFDTTINFHSYNQKLQPSKSIIKLENKGFFEKLFEYFSRN